LIQLTPDSKSLAPMLATSWKWNSNNTELTMSLRKGVTFQDGSAFNADVAVENLKVAAAPGSNGQTQLASMTSVVAVDPDTIRLSFSRPDPGVVFALEGYPGIMVSPAGLANPSLMKTQPMGSGPYKLVSTSAALSYTYDYYTGYWDKSHVYPAHMKIVTLSDPNQVVNSITTGLSDVALIATAQLPTIQSNKDVQLATYQSLGLQSVFMNNKIAPLDNLKVRQAVSLALDRQAFNAADNGACIPVDQAFLPGMVGYDPSLKPTTNVALAKQMIQQAGADGASITMLGIPNEPYKSWAEVAQSELDAIGLKIKLDIVPGTVYRTMYMGGGYGMLEAAPLVSANDPSQVLDQYVVGAGNPGTKDPALLAKIQAAESLSLGTSQRNSAFQEINRELTNNYVFWAPECLPVYTYAGNKNLIGLNSMQDAFSGVPDLDSLQIAK
jgi:peptide/nickel transport system substrate-binding protein